MAISDERQRAREAARRRVQEDPYSENTLYALPEGRKLWKFSKKGFPYTKDFDVLPYKISDTKHPDLRGSRPRAKLGDLVEVRRIWVHNKVGAEEGKYLCLNTWGEPCPICKFYRGEDYEKVAPFLRKPRELRNILDLTTAEDEENGIQLFDMSVKLFGELLELKQNTDPDEKYWTYWWPSDGYTLRVGFKGGTMPGAKDPFPQAFDINFMQREPYLEDDPILKQVMDIDSILKKYSYEQLEQLCLEGTMTETAPTTINKDEGMVATRRRTVAATTTTTVTEQEPEVRNQHPIDPDQDCPSGFVFGKDCGDKKECVPCEKWDDCREEKDNLGAGGRITTQVKPTPQQQPVAKSAPTRRSRR